MYSSTASASGEVEPSSLLLPVFDSTISPVFTWVFLSFVFIDIVCVIAAVATFCIAGFTSYSSKVSNDMVLLRIGRLVITNHMTKKDKSFSFYFYLMKSFCSTCFLILKSIHIFFRTYDPSLLLYCAWYAWLWDVLLWCCLLAFMARSWRVMLWFDWGHSTLHMFNMAVKQKLKKYTDIIKESSRKLTNSARKSYHKRKTSLGSAIIISPRNVFSSTPDSFAESSFKQQKQTLKAIRERRTSTIKKLRSVTPRRTGSLSNSPMAPRDSPLFRQSSPHSTSATHQHGSSHQEHPEQEHSQRHDTSNQNVEDSPHPSLYPVSPNTTPSSSTNLLSNGEHSSIFEQKESSSSIVSNHSFQQHSLDIINENKDGQRNTSHQIEQTSASDVTLGNYNSNRQSQASTEFIVGEFEDVEKDSDEEDGRDGKSNNTKSKYHSRSSTDSTIDYISREKPKENALTPRTLTNKLMSENSIFSELMKINATPDIHTQSSKQTLAGLFNQKSNIPKRFHSITRKSNIVYMLSTVLFSIVLIVLSIFYPMGVPSYSECILPFNQHYNYLVLGYYIQSGKLLMASLILFAFLLYIYIRRVYDYILTELPVVLVGTLIMPAVIVISGFIFPDHLIAIQHYILTTFWFLFILSIQIISVFIPTIKLCIMPKLRKRWELAKQNQSQTSKTNVTSSHTNKGSINRNDTEIPTIKRKDSSSNPKSDQELSVPSIKRGTKSRSFKVTNSSSIAGANHRELAEQYPFEMIIKTPQLREAFKKMLLRLLCVENLLFLEEIQVYKQLEAIDKRREMATEIINRYVQSGSQMELNISTYDKISMVEKFQLLNATCPINLFKELELTVKYTLKTDCYDKFLESSQFKDYLKKQHALDHV